MSTDSQHRPAVTPFSALGARLPLRLSGRAMRRIAWCGLIAWWLAVLGLCSAPRAQDGGPLTATVQQVRSMEVTWRLAAVPTPGPAWGRSAAEPAREPPKPRGGRIERLVAEADRCVVVWRSQRRHVARSKIECWSTP